MDDRAPFVVCLSVSHVSSQQQEVAGDEATSYKQLCKPKEPRIAVSTVITN